PAVVCALTTAAPQQEAPWIEISGPAGSHRLCYTEDRSVRTAADGEVRELAHERVDLMENLIAHVRDRQVPLLSSLASTGAFSAVLEAIQSVPDPLPIETGVDWVGRARPPIRWSTGSRRSCAPPSRPGARSASSA